MRLESFSVQYIDNCLQTDLGAIVSPGTELDIAVVTLVYIFTALYPHGGWRHVGDSAIGVHNHVCMYGIMVDSEKHKPSYHDVTYVWCSNRVGCLIVKYRARSLGAARLGNMSGDIIPTRLSNSKTIEHILTHISSPDDFARSYYKTSYRIWTRRLWYCMGISFSLCRWKILFIVTPSNTRKYQTWAMDENIHFGLNRVCLLDSMCYCEKQNDFG